MFLTLIGPRVLAAAKPLYRHPSRFVRILLLRSPVRNRISYDGVANVERYGRAVFGLRLWQHERLVPRQRRRRSAPTGAQRLFTGQLPPHSNLPHPPPSLQQRKVRTRVPKSLSSPVQTEAIRSFTDALRTIQHVVHVDSSKLARLRACSHGCTMFRDSRRA